MTRQNREGLRDEMLLKDRFDQVEDRERGKGREKEQGKVDQRKERFVSMSLGGSVRIHSCESERVSNQLPQGYRFERRPELTKSRGERLLPIGKRLYSSLQVCPLIPSSFL